MDDAGFEEAVQQALDALPAELRHAMSNVDVVIEQEAPPGERLLGLYEGIPLTERGSTYGAVLPDKITLFRGPLQRASRGDEERLRAEIRRTVWHEIAHHFGIDDDRLVELDRY
ncbi:MAG TPA: metallopeptidase family protein [Gaiellaceae bacterium]|jgi:predicted Zn-dependent protease with MMP-like domain|nr:metallopeptidase family protein [Gaiellaceae bacterium]